MENQHKTSENFEIVLGAYPTRKYMTVAILSGFGLMFLGWIIACFIHSASLTLIGVLHKINPLLFVLDLMPIVFGGLAYLFAKRGEKNRTYLQEILSDRNLIIQKNAEFAKRIGEGDFSVDVEMVDKSDTLGNSLLIMRNNLLATYQKETEQNWIAKGKEIIADVLRHHTNIDMLAYETLVSLINYTNMVQGAFYLFDEESNKLRNIATYAYNRKKYLQQEFKIGQGLVGQAAFERDIIYRREIPKDYITISSGILGDKKPKTLLFAPLISDEKLHGIIEISSLEEDIPEHSIKLVKELGEIIAQTLFNLKVNKRTEELLAASQKMTAELKKNEEELKLNAMKMKAYQNELEESNKKLAAQISEVEKGRKRLYSLLENASEVITIYDEKGVVTYVSPSVNHILGYSPEHIEGENAFLQDNLESTLAVKNAFEYLLANPTETKVFEYKFERNSREDILWLEATGRNLLKDAAIKGIIFNTRDITVRKIAERAQRMSGEMQALSENSPDMIVRLSPDNKFFYANPVTEIFTGVKAKELSQKALEEVNINEAIVKFFKNALQFVVGTQEKYTAETTFPSINGNRIMQVNVIPEFNQEKTLETILFVAHDVTERKQIEIEIEEKNKSITESINYAQRIQSAILPDYRVIREHIPHSFMLYRPRDVVSGDFPWFFIKDDNIFIAVVDCTGHGVPGALLSFVAYFTLNTIVDHDGSITAGGVLDALHIGVRRTLKQDRDDASARDGMDIALCKISKKNREVHFSGAHRPLFLLRGQEFSQFKGNQKAIGGIPPAKKKEDNFTDHVINYETGDKILFFSDGLPDQIGGPDGRKYQANRIKDGVLTHPEFSMEQFFEYFEQDFQQWKGDNKQIDDILLIGIEL